MRKYLIVLLLVVAGCEPSDPNRKPSPYMAPDASRAISQSKMVEQLERTNELLERIAKALEAKKETL